MADEPPKPPQDPPAKPVAPTVVEPWMGAAPQPPAEPPAEATPAPPPVEPKAVELIPVKVAPAPPPPAWPWADEPAVTQAAPPPAPLSPPTPEPSPPPTMEWPWPATTERAPVVHYAASDGSEPPPRPAEPPAPTPAAAAPAEPEVDPDHFAIAEVDYETHTWLDRVFGWLAGLLGARAEVDGHDGAVVERARGWTTRVILFATLTLLILNAASLKNWASTMEPNWGSSTLRLIAGEWADRLQSVGLDEPRRRVHAAYETEKTLSWHGKVTPPRK
jgi:hypothetical protein